MVLEAHVMNRNRNELNPCHQTVQSVDNGVIGIADLPQKLDDFRQGEK